MTTKLYQFALKRTKTEGEFLKPTYLSHAKVMKDRTRKLLTDERLRGQREKSEVFLQGFNEMINEKLEDLDYKERVFEAEKLMVNWLLVIEVEIFLLVNGKLCHEHLKISFNCCHF